MIVNPNSYNAQRFFHLVLKPMVLCIWASSLFAQAPFAIDKFHLTSQYSIEVWNATNGLPNNSVQDIAQTPDGYMWFGTFNGFVRFDGIHFRHFTTSNTPQMMSKNVESMAVDSKRALWLTLQNGGIIKVNEHTLSFFGTAQGLKLSVIWTVCADNRDNSILIAADNGIHRLRETNGRALLTYDSLLNQSVTEPPEVIMLDKFHNAWMGTINEGLFYRTPNGLQHLTTAEGLPENNIKSLYEDPSDGTIWIGTSKGLCAWRNGRVLTAAELGLPTIDSPIWTLLRDHEGYLWFGSNQGLYRWENHPAQREQNKLQQLTTSDGLSDNSVRYLMQDVENNIWAGTYFGGVSKLKRSRVTVVGKPEGLVNDIVFSVRTTRDSSLLVGTVGGFHRFRSGNLSTLTQKNGLIADVVRCAVEDRQGSVWIATMRGLQRIEPNGKMQSFSTKNGLVDNQIRTLLEARDSTLWIATTRGLNGFRNGKFSTYTTKDGLSFRGLVSLYEDSRGALWIGTGGGGVNVLEHGIVTKKYHRAQGLTTDVVFAFYEDPLSNDMWIGGNGCLARLRNGVITTLTAKNGLPDDDVFSIVEDKHGRLWMGCNIGIISVSKMQLNECADGKRQRLDYTLYDRTNGMRTSNHTVPGTGCTLPDGRLAFPTIKGVVIIDPNNMPKDTIPPKVQVQELIADTLHFTTLRQTLQATPEQLLRGESLTIPAGKTNIEIRYTALNFYAPEKVCFKYRLEGVDDAWIDAGTRREVFYTNLAPREYSFRVIACNSDGVWNELGAELRFSIEPLWWETWWFYGLCIMIVSGGSYEGFRWRTRRLRSKAEALERVVENRTKEVQTQAQEIQLKNSELQEQLETLRRTQNQLAQAEKMASLGTLVAGVAHELNTPIGVAVTAASTLHVRTLDFAKHYSEGALKKSELEAYVQTAQTGADLTLRNLERAANLIQSFKQVSVDQTYDNIRRFRVKQYLHEIITSLQPKWKTTGHRVEIECDETLEMETYAGAIAQIITNFVTNSLLHGFDGLTEEGVMRIEAEQEGNNVVIKYSDNGCGIPPEVLPRIFDPFFTTKQANGGTGLGMHIVYNLVTQKLGGTIKAESHFGSGVHFSIHIPNTIFSSK